MGKTKREKMSKKSVAAFLSVVTFVAGVVLSILSVMLSYFQTESGATWRKVCLYGGIALVAVGVIGVIVCVAVYRKADKRASEEKAKAETLRPDAPVTYIPAEEASRLVTVGSYQTVDEKFAQIAKMDKTQFVIYVARLFSRKGYQVKLTPVIDNHDIDLLVEKMGVTIAVSCILSNRVLCKEDIVGVRDGRYYYNVNNGMALTNMYFDRTAVQYAQAERISLVDRNLLADDFMN